jgi:hypothetical protein
MMLVREVQAVSGTAQWLRRLPTSRIESRQEAVRRRRRGGTHSAATARKRLNRTFSWRPHVNETRKPGA